ncbi:MAG: hypothetical protein QE269_09115 [Fimbriimonas sp.]|nr:hypothetical protein [Fimbriimonas sp.]
MISAVSLLLTQVSGDAVIRGRTPDSEIVITTTTRVAGAIHSLKWRGKEFIDSTDHGRQLQSAANFDGGSPITDETYNPTEAGSRSDGTGPTSSSDLLSIDAKDNRLIANSRLAFWLAPGESSGSNLAKNTTVLSPWYMTKYVTIGTLGRSQLIEYQVVFGAHPNERQKQAVFESLTGYMPAEFSKFFRFDAKSSKLEPLSDGPGEQLDPIVFSTPDGKFAMGIYVPAAPPGEYQKERDVNRYGRWRFKSEKVVKWNCVSRVKLSDPPGWHFFYHYLAIGTREQVRKEMEFLSRAVF